MVSTLILMLSIVWAIYDEVYARRPGRITRPLFPLYSMFSKISGPARPKPRTRARVSGILAMQAELEQAEAAATSRSPTRPQVNRGVRPA